MKRCVQFCVIVVALCLPAHALVGDAVTIVSELTAHRAVPTYRPAVVERTLSNGMRCYFAEDHVLPLFRLSLWFPGGAIYDPADKIGLYGMLGTMLKTGGSVARTPQEVDDWLDAHAVDIDVAMEWEQGIAKVSALRDDQPDALRVLFEQLYTPRFDSARWDLAIKNLRDAVARRNEQPAHISARVFRQQLYGAQSSWARTVGPTDIDALRLDDVKALHATLLAPQQLLCAAAGDFDVDTLVAELEQIMAQYSERPVLTWTPPPAPVPSDTGGTYFLPKALPQAAVHMGQRGLSRDDPDKFPLYIANEILGSPSSFTSWLRQEIRTKRGLAYEVGSNLQLGPAGAPGLWTAHAKTRSDAVAITIEVMRELLAQLVDGTIITAADVADTQSALLKRMIFQYADSFAVVSDMAQYVYMGLPAHYADILREGIRAVTLDEVCRVTRDRLHPDALTTVVVGDPATVLPALKALGPVTERPLD